jgi:hypothetical protein
MFVREGQASYTEGALRLLQYVESRRPSGRRFGADADARWTSFRGDLETADRIELLIRDADSEWPGAFGARTVYGMSAVPEDEPFGSQWAGLDPIEAEELWRRAKASPPPTSPADALQSIAAAWRLPLAPCAVGAVGPNDRLVVVGPSAIVATILAFAAGADLDWAEQVTVVAGTPAHRQLAVAATALLNTKAATRVLIPADAASGAISAGTARLIASPDADPTDQAAAHALVGV